MSNRIFLKGAACLGLILALTACGDSGGGGGNSGIDTSQPLADSFFLQVLALVATSPDDTEPRETDSINATSPENTEPIDTPG
jgi:hypothetical protein